MWFRYSDREIAKLFANSEDPAIFGSELFASYPFVGLQTKMG